MGRQRFLEPVLIVCGIFLVGGFANVIPQKDQDEGNQGLYNSSDFVTILDVNNFKPSIYNSKRAWLVEFYNSWCGFCHRFAPIWKSVAKSLHDWKDIVVIAALDCANDDNNPLCREYEIMRYPTLKFFPVNSKKEFLGLEVQKGNDETQITETLIDQLVKEQQEQRSEVSWPNIIPFRGTEIETLWHGVPPSVQYEFLIFEETKSYLGIQVILDLHKLDNIRIRRVTSENEFLSVTSKVTKFPSLIVIDRDNSQTFLKIDTITREGIRSVIVEFLNIKGLLIDTEDGEEIHEINPPKMISNDKVKQQDPNDSLDKLYQLDLEAALRYSLNNEITLSSTINGEKLKALKSYLIVLAEYFPVHLPKGKTYLQVLKEIVENKKNITGKEFKKHVQDKEQKFMPVYSGPKTWIGCKGSLPSLRGYPCGLWTLFHTLTVATAEESNGFNDDVPSVLTAMHGYIKNFFGCADCSAHFQKMAEKRKLFDVRDGDESILWLWRAHNEVNKRLASDATEDPEHKKIQYPSAQNCPECKRPDGIWDENEVLKYLKRKYSRRNIDFQGISKNILERQLDSGALLSSGASQRKLGWDFTIFDISICVVLYVTSAAILTLVCIKFAFKRTYKKKVSFQNLLGIA